MNISNDVYFIKRERKESRVCARRKPEKKHSRCKLTDDSVTTVYLSCISPGLMNKMRRASFPIQPNETLCSTVSSYLKTLSLEMLCFKGSVSMWKRAAGAIKCGTEVCGITSYQIYSLSIDIHQYLQNTHTGHLLVPGCTSLAFRAALIIGGIDSTKCWKHSLEIWTILT